MVGYAGMMKQMNKMQRDIEKTQAKLAEMNFEGVSGNGAVRVAANGNKKVTAIEIAHELVDVEDKDILQDLLVVAVNDVLTKVEETTEKEMSKVTGGLNIPGLF